MKMLIPMGELRHGDEIPGKLGRWCARHKKIHGRFYVCDEYPRQIQEAIKQEERRHLSVSASIAMTILFVVLLVITAME